jgi:hypothetical protein
MPAREGPNMIESPLPIVLLAFAVLIAGCGARTELAVCDGDGGSACAPPVDGGEPEDAGPPDSGLPDASPPDGGATNCTVFETSIECMQSTVVFVGTTGSTGGHFTYVDSGHCLGSITDINCNTSSSLGTICSAAQMGSLTVTHDPCDGSPPCSVTFPVTCPP